MSANNVKRLSKYHGGAKGPVVGNGAGRPAPAWRASNMASTSQAPNGVRVGADPGGKILLSNLPPDVSEEEIVDLMKKTIGPVNMQNSFMIYNVKGFPRGMAVVAFVRIGDAMRARQRYNGKVIDGKRAIKLEIVLDRDEATRTAPPSTSKPRSLVDRLAPVPSALPPRPSNPAGTKRPPLQPRIQQANQKNVSPGAPVQHRKKKGPRRVRKSVTDLDREMEEYIAQKV